jgi:hypothetical protein
MLIDTAWFSSVSWRSLFSGRRPWAAGSRLSAERPGPAGCRGRRWEFAAGGHRPGFPRFLHAAGADGVQLDVRFHQHHRPHDVRGCPLGSVAVRTWVEVHPTGPGRQQCKAAHATRKPVRGKVFGPMFDVRCDSIPRFLPAGFPPSPKRFSAMPELARRIGRAKPSAIMLVAEKAKRLKSEGRDIISFSIGVPNFLPGDHVYAAAREALAKDSGQYGSNRGADALLDAFLAHIAQIGLTGYTRATCATGIGAKHVIYNLAEALLDEGDTICFAGAVLDQLPRHRRDREREDRLLPCPASQDYKLTPAQLDAALAKKPKVFLFNNPSNPTGMVYTKDEIVALADVLAKYPDTWVITDDIYNRMVFDGVGYHNFVQRVRSCASA